MIEDLGAGPVALDPSPFIYFIEEHPRYLSLVRPIFHALDAGALQAMTSTLTLLEVLVVPYRANDTALALRYETILTRSRGLRLIDLSFPQLRAAAQLRAATGMKIPDALQVTAALSAGCAVLLTNDDRWPPSVGDLRVLSIDSYVNSQK